MTPFLENLLSGFARWIRKEIRERALEWARLAAEEPLVAAEHLDMLAIEAESRSRAFKNQKGWRARVWRERARSLQIHADDLRRRASGMPCLAEPTRRPGT